MATLVSPGVSISVVDQSINVGANPGTVPLIFIATQQDKTTPDGLGIAEGTTKANVGKVWSITSQRELVQTFGDPAFYSVSGTSLNGYPLNEYGLLAAYSFLGISNLTRIARADVDTAQLEPTPIAPTSPAAAGTVWLDESSSGSSYGLFVRAGTVPNETWSPVTIKYVYNFATGFTGAPTPSDGVDGDYAVVWHQLQGNLSYWVKQTGVWAQLGTGTAGYTSAAGATSSGNTITVASVAGLTVGMIVNVSAGDGLFQGGTYVTSIDTLANTFTTSTVPLIALSGGASVVDGYVANTTVGSVWPDLTSSYMLATYWVKTGSAAQGANIVLRRMSASTNQFVQVDSPILADESAAYTYYSTDATQAAGKFYFQPSGSGVNAIPGVNNSISAKYSAAAAGPWNTASNIVGSQTVPTSGAENGQMWFNALLGLDSDGKSTVDILVNDGQDHWLNCNLPGFTLPGALGNPTLYVQSLDPLDDAVPPVLSTGDVWVQTDASPYPVIYRWNNAWVLVSNTDQTTPNGIIFQDARPNPEYQLGGTIGTGAYNGGGDNPDLDPDAPQAALYPKGFLLWNTRYSTNNVKEWQSPYVFDGVTASPDNTNNDSTGRWVNISGNSPEGVPYMGAEAQRIVIVKAIQETIVSNENIRAEDLYFNLIAAPGFVEAIDEMLALNDDRKDTAFVVGDTPFTLAATGTTLQNWATNTSTASSNSVDGLVSASKYFAAWYPSGLGTNVDGTEVVVPPSHMALRTIAYNDQVAYPWFAPAGLQRGVVNNVASVGYVNASGQYVSTKLTEGQRDILYQNGINPIRVMPQGGIVIFGQKTRQPYASATDRINVVRLENYLRYQLNNLAQPFLFEPNDSTTRKAVKAAFDGFLSELITLRGLYDFLVVCDMSNNTPARIDRNELWIDIAIQPVKAIEFIYIPIRIKNTGASLTSA